MIFFNERLLILKTGRSVKVVASRTGNKDLTTAEIEWDILIKDPKDQQFHPLISSSHPMFWKIKKLTPMRRKLVELQYAGINKRETKKIFTEWNMLTDNLSQDILAFKKESFELQ